MPSRRVSFLLLVLISVCITPATLAHPMGNFSVNQYSKISLESDGITIRYILDLAEIPTYQELQEGNVPANAADPAVAVFLAARGEALGRGLSLVIDGKAVPLHLVSKQVIFPPGAGGLPTMKMGFVYHAAYPAGAAPTGSTLHYSDNNFQGHAGWKEIVVPAYQGYVIRNSAPRTDRSAELTNYPTELLNSPPQDLEASVQFRYPTAALAAQAPLNLGATQKAAIASTPERQTLHPNRAPFHVRLKNQIRAATTQIRASESGVAQRPQSVTAAPAESLHLKANQQATPRNAFTELIATSHLSLWFLLTAALIALGLGALHALEPGHGKTIVAAYLVASRGTARHAVLLGTIVTISHTAGVFALGAVTLYASRYIVPEQLYPWLGVLSGLIIAGLGGYMFLRRWTGVDAGHTHTPGQLHGHWFSSKQKRSEQVASAETIPEQTLSTGENPRQTVTLSQLFALGITGGIIPCPAALVVLLSAFALHRIALGLFLILAFSVGLAAVLIGFGMLMVYARRFVSRLVTDGPLTTRWLPVVSAAFMTVLGAAIAIHAFAATNLNRHLLVSQKLGSVLLVAGLGVVLGMRHSTDPDHVVAVSTIVSKQRSIRHAALIGSLWGLGHTLTIFVVGSMIIVFGVVIPPRLGLSMEFSVALMLILLGVLNLTGVTQKITDRLTGVSRSDTLLTVDPRCEKTGTEVLLDRSIGRFGIYQCARPLIIGIVHGLAGSAAVALLVLSTIHNPLWATMYLLIFGAGTMAGMMCMTTVMAIPLAYAGNRFVRVSQYLGIASGLVSVCFGVFLVYQLGFLGGLFTNHPQWTAR
jgi:ABC-type nickel/cobalt efflux system permease component RcnA